MFTLIRRVVATLAAIALIAAALIAPPVAAQTPEAGPLGCNAFTATAAESTPRPGHGPHGMAMHDAEFDLFYIDMMIPHHESVIALATVARHHLTHPRLIEIADAIVETQVEEIEQLREWRDAWYPDAPPVEMSAMMEMPGMASNMAMMDAIMSTAWQVESFCAADNFNLTFIEQVIPHHEMAIMISEAALEQAEHPELVELARAVIAAQQAEIDELAEIRAELTAAATPAA